jgi:protein-disulfide isomerase
MLKQNVILYLIAASLLMLGIASLFSLNELKDKVKRIESSQAKIQYHIFNNKEPVDFDFSNGFAIGDDAAPVNMAIFLDYQCGYCKLFFDEVYPPLYDEFIANGLLRFVIIDFPLKSHELAFPIAQYSRCAQQNGSYGSFINKVFGNPDAMDRSKLENIASEMGLDPSVCLEDSSIYKGVLKDYETGISLGVNGTPTFILNNQIIVGFKRYAELESLINSTLKAKEAACK